MLKDSILQKLATNHQNTTKPLNLGVYYKNTLIALCHALEDFILDSESQPMMIAAFQRGKWYLEEAERYEDLAKKSQHVAIMAASDAGFDTHPTSQKSNVSLIKLTADDPVAQEWHLMILSPTYTAMVLCQELSEADYGVGGQPKDDLERKFYGFWTFEPDLVKETVELAISHIATYDKELAQNLTTQIKAMDAHHKEQHKDDLVAVVTKVVGYLQDCQETLHQPQKSGNFDFFQALDDNILSNEMQAFLRMAQIIDSTDTLNPMGATEVATLSEAMGQLLDLPAWQIKRLKLAGLLHRLGSLPQSSELDEPQSPIQQEALDNPEELSKSEVLRIMPQLQAIAKIVNHQTEAWDGSGTPSGLAYDNIPLESRIIRLLTDFQRKVTQYNLESTDSNALTQAFTECQQQAGSFYDPKLVEALSLLVMGMQQGMNLQSYQPKIASGIWLIEN
ncbi:MAG: DICT sensory domain-containing protein [Xenococcaceae cyanobacterium MO_167.B52]|nr:DICT sensory domain-containing protein [Xenococcaceae cyanobacterium MO_167.B52]